MQMHAAGWHAGWRTCGRAHLGVERAARKIARQQNLTPEAPEDPEDPEDPASASCALRLIVVGRATMHRVVPQPGRLLPLLPLLPLLARHPSSVACARPRRCPTWDRQLSPGSALCISAYQS
jgi:hypothetical protein